MNLRHRDFSVGQLKKILFFMVQIIIMHKSVCSVSLTFEKRIVKYENDTISKEECKNAMNSVISAVQTLVSSLLLIQ